MFSIFLFPLYKIINKISDADIVDGARDFRLMKREMVDAIIQMSAYRFISLKRSRPASTTPAR